MRVELGSGLYPRNGYTHLDIDSSLPCIEVVGDIRRLPFAYCSIDEILIVNVLEHFFYDEIVQILHDLYAILRTGGVIKCYVPDILQITERIVKCESRPNYSVSDIVSYIGYIYGNKQKYYQHHFGFTARLLAHLLDMAGFIISRIDNTDGIYVEAYKK